MSNIKDIDRGWNKIKYNALHGQNRVSIGIRGGGIGKNDLATIGLYHEKGGKRPGWSKGCPPKRSFIGSTIDEKKWKYQLALDRVADKILSGAITKSKGLHGLGFLLVKDIKSKIRKGILPALADSTKKAKARIGKAKNTPLIFRGRLINSLTHWLSE
jgi:hypothetical protein